jgi:hypothetical protein
MKIKVFFFFILCIYTSHSFASECTPSHRNEELSGTMAQVTEEEPLVTESLIERVRSTPQQDGRGLFSLLRGWWCGKTPSELIQEEEKKRIYEEELKIWEVSMKEMFATERENSKKSRQALFGNQPFELIWGW